MTATTETNNIFKIVRCTRDEKLPYWYDVVHIKPSAILILGFATNLAMTLSPFSGKSTYVSPHSIVECFAPLPVRMRLTHDVFGNPSTSTFPRTETTPRFTNKRCGATEFLAAIIALKDFAITLFAESQNIKDMQINCHLGSVKMICYLSRCHRGVIGNNIILFYFSPAFAFKLLPFLRTFHRAIFSLVRRIAIKFLSTIQARLSYHSLIISQNFIWCKHPEVDTIDNEDVLVFSK